MNLNQRLQGGKKAANMIPPLPMMKKQAKSMKLPLSKKTSSVDIFSEKSDALEQVLQNRD